MALKVAKNFSLPDDAVTQTLAILAKRGAGKSYTAMVITEEMVSASLPVVALDPIGVWWGLRSSANGKRDGLPIVILGGDHGDVPLEHTAGEVIADWVVAEHRPAVLDLSLFRKGEQRRFVTDFAEQLYRKNREALHLMIDEADAFAPQRPQHGEQRMLGAVEDLVRRGRARGIGVTLITQRSAVLNKDVLTQVEVLIAMRMLSPHDRKAIEAWIDYHGTVEERRQVLASLPKLPVGTAWFWSPAWLGKLRKVAIRKRRTFDSSATPKVGARIVKPKLAPVDFDDLSCRIQDTIERAKEEDPKHLRKQLAKIKRSASAEIADLKRQLEDREVEQVEVEVPVVHALAPEVVQDVAIRVSEATEALVSANSHLERLKGLANKAAIARAERLPPLAPKRSPLPASPPAKPPTPKPRPARLPKAEGNNLAGGERKILSALVVYGAMGKTKLAILTTYKHSGGGFNNYLSSLRSKGYITRGHEIGATDEGHDAVGAVDPLPVGRALLDHWLGHRAMGKAERTVMEVLYEAYPDVLDKESIAEQTGYQASGGGFNNALSKLRTLGLIEGRGDISASDHLFSERSGRRQR